VRVRGERRQDRGQTSRLAWILIVSLPVVMMAAAGSTATPAAAQAAGGRDAYRTIQAASFDAQSGTQTEPTHDRGGGMNVRCNNGDWMRYRGVNFGKPSPRTVQVRVASGARVSGTVEFHLDSISGKLIGSVSIAPSGGWQTFRSVSASVAGATGTHTVFVVCRSSPPGDVANINWFVFQR